MTPDKSRESAAPKLEEIADTDLDEVQGGKKASSKKLAGDDIGARGDGSILENGAGKLTGG